MAFMITHCKTAFKDFALGGIICIVCIISFGFACVLRMYHNVCFGYRIKLSLGWNFSYGTGTEMIEEGYFGEDCDTGVFDFCQKLIINVE